jgi:hypothetical protein
VLAPLAHGAAQRLSSPAMKIRCNEGWKCVAPLFGAVCLALGLAAVPRAEAVSISVSSAQGRPGDTVNICVDLASEGQEVAGVQADVVTDSQCALIETTSCRKGNHNKELHKAKLSPSRMRAIVLALDNTEPIPDGTRLFCCDLMIPEDTTVTSCPVALQGAAASDSRGSALTARTVPGTILISGVSSGGTTGGGRVGAPVAPSSAGVAPPAVSAPAEAPSSGQAVTGGAAPKAPVVVAPVQPEQAPVAAGERPESAAPLAGEPQLTPTAAAGERPATMPRGEAAVTPQAVATKAEAGVQPTAAEAKPTVATAPTATRPAHKAAALATPTERAEDSGCQIEAQSSASGMSAVLLLVGVVLVCLRGRRGGI